MSFVQFKIVFHPRHSQIFFLLHICYGMYVICGYNRWMWLVELFTRSPWTMGWMPMTRLQRVMKEFHLKRFANVPIQSWLANDPRLFAKSKLEKQITWFWRPVVQTYFSVESIESSERYTIGCNNWSKKIIMGSLLYSYEKSEPFSLARSWNQVIGIIYFRNKFQVVNLATKIYINSS